MACFRTVRPRSSSDSFGYPGSTPSLSADGTSGGIVWDVDHRHRRAASVQRRRVMATSFIRARRPHAIASRDRHAVPSIANGQVFVGTSDSLMIYGLLFDRAWPRRPRPANYRQSPLPATRSNYPGARLSAQKPASRSKPRPTAWISYRSPACRPTPSATRPRTWRTSTNYTFRVVAYNRYGPSGYSPTATASTGTAAGLTSVNARQRIRQRGTFALAQRHARRSAARIWS